MIITDQNTIQIIEMLDKLEKTEYPNGSPKLELTGEEQLVLYMINKYYEESYAAKEVLGSLFFLMEEAGKRKQIEEFYKRFSVWARLEAEILGKNEVV